VSARSAARPKPPTFDAATEAELDAAAEITPDDIARAQAAWRRDASPEFRDLLDARPVTGDERGA
jgi:hypothetical protein